MVLLSDVFPAASPRTEIFIILIFQQHSSAWPFTKPVDKTEAPDYYEHIKFPMGKLKLYGL